MCGQGQSSLKGRCGHYPVCFASAFLPTLAELLLPSKFSGFVGHGLVKGFFFGICWSGDGQGMFFFEFVGQVMVKGTIKGQKEKCCSGGGLKEEAKK